MRNLRDLFFVKRSSVKKRLAEEIELLHRSPLLDPVWYRQNHSDLRDRPVDVARHYLEYGAAEGRDPHPLFDTKYYMEQNPDVAATGMNPLVHYILHGAVEGRTPHPPKNDNAQDPSKGQGLPPVAPAALIAEPGIKPPLLVTDCELGAAELNRRNARIVSAVRSLRSKTEGDEATTARGLPRPEEVELSWAKLGLVAADDRVPGSLAISCLREARARDKSAGSYLETLLGLGITPNKTITEGSLPNHGVLIPQRYDAGRLEATRRFRLDPSRASTISDGPVISILMPAYKTPLIYLERAILSVLFQSYANWELLIVDDGSKQPDFESLLNYYAAVDKRVRVHFSAHNGGISAATNIALQMAEGSYVGLLDHDDMLTRDALERVANRLLDDDGIDLVYTDECKIDEWDIVDDLFHKPDWSPLLLLNSMYTGHFSVYRKALVEKVGRFRSEFDFSQDYDLALRVAEQTPKVSHIEECLYGWRMIPGSSSVGDKPAARISNIAALQSAADRRGYDGTAIALPAANRLKRRLLAKGPLVSIVVPSDNVSNIQATIDSIRGSTSYQHYEIIVVTNTELVVSFSAQTASPDTRFVNYDEPFNFSAKCNAGAHRAKGDYLIFYNDDVRVISPDWIEVMLECLSLPGVGIAGPKMIYQNGTIQHAGMVTGVRRLIGTAFHSFPAQTSAYFNLAQSVRETSLICGACLAMPIRLFNDLGGWDTQNTPIAHSDVDLCFRVRDEGYSCVYTPHAELTHIGHLAIGAAEEEAKKKSKLFKRDKADIFVLKKWGKFIERDPYFPCKMRDLVYIDSQEEFVYERRRIDPCSHLGKDFILFSHDLSASGAPRCLHETARVLIDSGHYVLVVSPEDGRFRRRFTEIGADVIIDPLALSGHDSIIDLAKNFDFAICNTIVCWPVPKYLAPYLPVYLYSHETELVRHFRDHFPGFRDGLAAATALWAEGGLAVAKINEYLGLDALNIEPCVEELPDIPNGGEEYPGLTVIALVGTYEPRKGQDLAIDGFQKLPSEFQAASKLVMAGRTNDPHFRAAIEAKANGNSQIILRDELNYIDVVECLKRADIVLAPSRDDAGPTTAIDALGAGKILIASAKTGIALHLVDGESGFILRDNGPDDICATICRAFEQRRRWPEIGAKAREVYQANFTRQRFREHLLQALSLDAAAMLSD